MILQIGVVPGWHLWSRVSGREGSDFEGSNSSEAWVVDLKYQDKSWSKLLNNLDGLPK